MSGTWTKKSFYLQFQEGGYTNRQSERAIELFKPSGCSDVFARLCSPRSHQLQSNAVHFAQLVCELSACHVQYQNDRQKVFSKGLDILKIWPNLHWFIVFHIPIYGLGALFGGLSPPQPPWRLDCTIHWSYFEQLHRCRSRQIFGGAKDFCQKNIWATFCTNIFS